MSGPYNIDFKLWDDPTSTDPVHQLWSELHSLIIINGQLDVILGSAGTPISASYFDGVDRWLEVALVGAGGALSPRVPLSSVPYALRVDTIDGAQGGTIIGGLTAGQLVGSQLTVNGLAKVTAFQMDTGAVAGHVLTTDDLGNATWQEGGSGSGTPGVVADQLEIQHLSNTEILLDAWDDDNGSIIKMKAGGIRAIELDAMNPSPPSEPGAEIRLYHSSAPNQPRTYLGSGSLDYGGYLYLDRSEARIVQIDISETTPPAGRLWLRNGYGHNGIRLLGDSPSFDNGPALTMWNDDGSVQTVEIVGTGSGSGDGSHLILSDTSGYNTLKLDAQKSAGGGSVHLRNRYNGSTVILEGDRDSDPGNAALLMFDHSGNQTIRIFSHQSSYGGGMMAMDDGSGVENLTMWASEGATGGGQIELKNSSGGTTLVLDGDTGDADNNPRIRLKDSLDNVAIDITGVDGRIKAKIIEITEGSDLSEGFNITDDHVVLPGTVLAIDATNPGHLTVCREAYDRKVAGVVSGANGIRPGLLMGQAGSVADGSYPVALTGRVYVKAETSQGVIQPGDLLTSSPNPGYAMKVTDYTRAQGAIIGKALTALNEPEGHILVLITLQ